MPIYEYACKACGASLEVRQKFSDDPLTECPECGAPSLERLVSASSFALKGDGWYADGYGGKKQDAKKAESSTSESKDSGSSSADKPDSKKETKPAAKETKKAS